MQTTFKHNNFSLIKLNCDTEFEFLQLLDILYYTENSNKYRIFIRNLIQVLISNENERSNENQSKKKVLSNIVLMACDFMLPEFKQIEKVAWSSDNIHSTDSDSIKIKSTTETSVEDSIQFPLFQSFVVQSKIIWV